MSVCCAEEPPNPGSTAAIALGCICAVLDNNHGLYAPWPPDGYWITQGCPVHASGWPSAESVEGV